MSSYRIDDEPVMPPVTTTPIRDGAGLQQVTLPISISFSYSLLLRSRWKKLIGLR